jgi:hypothetical protein
MRQQAGSREAVLDRSRRCRCFYNPFPACAGELRPHMSDQLIRGRNTFQLLRYVFPELTQCLTATRTARVVRQMRDALTRKAFRQLSYALMD